MSNLVPAIEADVVLIAKALVSSKTIEKLAVDAVPRPVEAKVYAFFMSLSAMLELAITALPGDPLNVLLSEVKTSIDAVSVPPAGSAQLENLGTIYNLVEAYLTGNSVVGATSATKAVVKAAN